MGDEEALQRTTNCVMPTMPASRRDVAAQVEDYGPALTDINSATPERLCCLNGIGVFYANRIVKGRPYCDTLELVEKHVLPQSIYNRMKEQIVAQQP